MYNNFMQITSGVKFRIRPSDAQATILSQWIGCQRLIYNAKVAEDRYFRSFLRKSLPLTGLYSPVDQKYSQFIGEDTFFLKDVPSQILRNGAYRWMTGYQRFFNGLSQRPVFKRKHGRQTVLITSELFFMHPTKDAIVIGTNKYFIGSIPFKHHGGKKPDPKSICIARHSGKWWLSFNYTQEYKTLEQPLSEQELIDFFRSMSQKDQIDTTIGFDRGVVIPVACSDGTNFEFDNIVKKRLAKKEVNRRRYQRKQQRQQKGSKRSFKTKCRIDKTYAYQANARNDFAHKTSRKIVDSSARVLVFEDLKIKNMTKQAKPKKDASGKYVRNGAAAKAGLNRAILGSAWSSVVRFTQYKGLRKNKLTVKVTPNGTSQECSKCGHTHPDNRESQSLFVCQKCAFELNADYNASLNIKNKGIELILSAQFAPKEKKTVRFKKNMSKIGDGTPFKRGPCCNGGQFGSGTTELETSVSRCSAMPGSASVDDPRNPHYNSSFV